MGSKSIKATTIITDITIMHIMERMIETDG
jgi:hypothetical protein